MLPVEFKPHNYDSFDREPWPDYVERLALPDDEATLQFFRQVAYDHLDHFNDHYPSFNLADYRIRLEVLTTQEANDQIRFFGNEPMDLWAEQYEHFAKTNNPYIIYQEMSKNLTPPFPPVLLDSSKLADDDWRVYGHPLHLIEGTHRVGYLRHMLGTGLISPESRHTFVVLRQAEDATQ